MKNKNGQAERRKSPKRNRMPRWKCRLEDYRDIARLNFPTEKDMDAAIELVWVGKLQGMPFNLGGDGESLVVPKVSIPFFTKAGIEFEEKTKKK